MKTLKYFLIRCADWFDDQILQHRFYAVCERVTFSDWWGDHAETTHADWKNGEDDDELPDPAESFRIGWGQAMRGETMTEEEFRRRMLEYDAQDDEDEA